MAQLNKHIRLLIWGLRVLIPSGVLFFGVPFKPSGAGGHPAVRAWQYVRAVKQSDFKSYGLCRCRFKSCCCRFEPFCVPRGAPRARMAPHLWVHSSAVEQEIAELAVAGSIPAISYFWSCWSRPLRSCQVRCEFAPRALGPSV